MEMMLFNICKCEAVAYFLTRPLDSFQLPHSHSQRVRYSSQVLVPPPASESDDVGTSEVSLLEVPLE